MVFQTHRRAYSQWTATLQRTGALHAITHELITVTNESYINATSVCELLEKIAALGLSTPITLVMDNAGYQHCRLVLERAAALGIEILFLPAYSPNLI
jgi:transposase